MGIHAMSCGRFRAFVMVGVILAALCACSAGRAQDAPDRPGDVTFLVSGDSHFGAAGMEELNRRIVQQMNALPGTPWPASIGGKVDVPRGLLFMGDMTDSGLESEWAAFEKVYGLTGKDGLLKFPVFEAIGNHDIPGDAPVKDHVRKRHGSLIYSWDWGDVHFVCLDLYPDAASLKWLKSDLEKVGKRPLIIYFHYTIQGPYDDGWRADEKVAFAEAIKGRNVLAIFHGHYHMAGRYQWKGYDVFLPGSPRHASHTLIVVRITADRMYVGYWDWEAKGFREVVTKQVTR